MSDWSVELGIPVTTIMYRLDKQNMSIEDAFALGYMDRTAARRAGSKITEEIAEQIRQATGLHREIGERFGISSRNVQRIKAGTRWTKSQ